MSNRRSNLSLITTTFLIIAGMCFGPSLASANEIKIGFTPPVTGASAAEGAWQVKAINLALKQINEAGGVNGNPITLIIEDNQSSNPGALAALQKAVEQDQVLALVGVVKSTQVMAMSDAIKSYAIPVMIGGTNATLTKQGNPWLFRVRPDAFHRGCGHGEIHQGRHRVHENRDPGSEDRRRHWRMRLTANSPVGRALWRSVPRKGCPRPRFMR